MPRIRTIKPEFWQSEKMARCSPHARLLAIALLQLADSEGRMRWIPMQVHAHAFPFEEDLEVNELAAELEAIGYLVRYEADGKRYACIPSFNTHQRLSGKEAAVKSNYPPPCPTGNESETAVKDRGSAEVFPVKHLDAQEQGTGNREQGKEIPTTSGPDGPPASVSDDEFIFTTGVEYLVRSGESEKSARSFLGRLKRDHGPPVVAKAIDSAMQACAVEPKSYLAKTLGAVKANGTTGEPHWI